MTERSSGFLPAAKSDACRRGGNPSSDSATPNAKLRLLSALAGSSSSTSMWPGHRLSTMWQKAIPSLKLSQKSLTEMPEPSRILDVHSSNLSRRPMFLSSSPSPCMPFIARPRRMFHRTLIVCFSCFLTRSLVSIPSSLICSCSSRNLKTTPMFAILWNAILGVMSYLPSEQPKQISTRLMRRTPSEKSEKIEFTVSLRLARKLLDQASNALLSRTRYWASASAIFCSIVLSAIFCSIK
mmetsp:Transcript_11021/g.20960  ORF Transcript_11021/g.20960 Transcript_11021/m.20960 type:complete len:239 (-) Transcript_11021:9-725(-)